MAYQSVTGTVGNAFERVTLEGKNIVSTKITLTFKLHGMPVVMESAAAVSNEDVVTIIGERKRGQFHAYALRNETTGFTYGAIGFEQLGMLAVFFLASLLSMSFVVGYALFAVSLWMSYRLFRLAKAQNQLRLTPPPGGWAFHDVRVPLATA